MLSLQRGRGLVRHRVPVAWLQDVGAPRRHAEDVLPAAVDDPRAAVTWAHQRHVAHHVALHQRQGQLRVQMEVCVTSSFGHWALYFTKIRIFSLKFELGLSKTIRKIAYVCPHFDMFCPTQVHIFT